MEGYIFFWNGNNLCKYYDVDREDGLFFVIFGFMLNLIFVKEKGSWRYNSFKERFVREGVYSYYDYYYNKWKSFLYVLYFDRFYGGLFYGFYKFFV